MNIDVEPTAETIDTAAKRLRQAAITLERIAANMRAYDDLSYAAEAIQEILNAVSSSRLDLLVTRPLHARERKGQSKLNVGEG